MKNTVFWDIKTSSYLTGNIMSATQPNRLMLYKILGFQCGDYEERRLLGYKTSSYLTGNTLRLCYTAQPVNAM
jgi:hypothetical protein